MPSTAQSTSSVSSEIKAVSGDDVHKQTRLEPLELLAAIGFSGMLI